MRGLSVWYGSWKTICTRRRSARQSFVTGAPSSSTAPSAAGTSPSIARASVDLPHPDSPTTPSTSPGCQSKETPSTARAPPR